MQGNTIKLNAEVVPYVAFIDKATMWLLCAWSLWVLSQDFSPKDISVSQLKILITANIHYLNGLTGDFSISYIFMAGSLFLSAILTMAALKGTKDRDNKSMTENIEK